MTLGAINPNPRADRPTWRSRANMAPFVKAAVARWLIMRARQAQLRRWARMRAEGAVLRMLVELAVARLAELAEAARASHARQEEAERRIERLMRERYRSEAFERAKMPPGPESYAVPTGADDTDPEGEALADATWELGGWRVVE